MVRMGRVQKCCSSPNSTTNATVAAADSSNDPRQPSRLEKKKNMGLLAQNIIDLAAARP
jgi:hypothetical protein